MTNRIKLSILGISFSQVQAGAYALIFAEENGIRRLPIVIGTPEAQSIAIVMEDMKPPRPLSHDLIYNIFSSLNVELVDVYIYKFEDGAFFAELTLRQNGVEYKIDSRTSDAVAIALRTHSPIYTTEEIMQNMSIVFDENEMTVETEPAVEEEAPKEKTRSSNIEEITLSALQMKLEEAIAEENYELATKLRDEIKRREEENS